MINLSPYLGLKRIAIIEGFGSFSVSQKEIELIMVVQILNQDNTLVVSNNIHQNRFVRYRINNINWVDAQFNPVEEGTPNAKKEFDYFFQLMNEKTYTTPELVIMLSQKLNERGIFN